MDFPKLFEQYVRHGLYMRGWSPLTVNIYRRAFANFQQSQRGQDSNLESLTKAQLEAWVAWMREQQRSPTYINIHIRAINAFLHWCHLEEHVPHRLTLKQVPNPVKALRGISDKEVSLILAYRPSRRNAFRTWTVIQMLLDTGLRIDEILNAELRNLDLDNLQLKVKGKGSKERIVPISIEGRKILFRYSQHKCRRDINSPYIFCSRNGSRLSYRNTYRDLKDLCKKAGVEGEHVHPHSFRHKFAVTYIRRGGDLYRLSRLLGHASTSTTELYLRSMGAEEVGERHSELSPLSRLR